ncbi:DHA2 family efflux MFS transporter permease subunit [Paenibacillus agricola]|uniref:DHA2 family efflux MFS transporter permease subunit n=1 Tax=Paenibacillus agricola TaxID=2716264 RepID=A0ABX0J3E8_9BACL|nr:DHA2 family efflux MFS transporter permease subunit [Paenibacillus agricola]NHN30860.1 DHA2 family efflux MFS transporter permease subunit [Paenibacillus agricola]
MNKSSLNKDSLQEVKFWPIMIAIFFGSFITVLSSSTVTIAIPQLQEHFATDLHLVQWTMTGFMLAMGTISPVAGYLGEKFSYKRLYFTALIGFTLASLLCALSWNIQSLIAFRIVQGIFSGLIMPATMTIIYQVIPRDKQAMAISLWGLSAMLAPAIGPTLAGVLMAMGGWQWLFIMNIPIGVIATAMVMWLIPFYRLNVPKSFDLPGLVTVFISSISLLVAFSQSGSWGWTDWKTVTLFIVGGIVLILFIWRELTVKEPLLNIRVLTNGRYTLTLIITTIITISLYSGTFLTPIFLQNIQHVSPLDTGLILLPASLAMALTMPIVGKFYSVVGPRLLMTIGIVLVIVGTFALTKLTIDISYMYILIWMMVRNVGIAFTMMPASNAGMEQISPMLSGHASSLSNWIRNVFGSFSIAIFTSLLGTFGSREAAAILQSGVQDAAQIQLLSFTASVNDVYLVATVIAILAVPLTLMVRKNKARAPQLDTSK